MKIRIQIYLLLAAIILVFMPGLFADECGMDDRNLFASLESVTSWNFKSLLPGGWTYYRPLTIFSYHFDKLVWQLNPLAMHGGNLLLHAANALLVFFLTRTFLSDEDKVTSYLPFAAAMLFGLHPLSTESVNWISGRTDPLAAFFILTATLAIMHYRKHGRIHSLLLAGIFFVFGVLSKEVAIAFLPGAICLLFAKEGDARSIIPYRPVLDRVQILWSGAWIGTTLAGILFLYYLSLKIKTGKLALTLKFIFTDLWYAFFVCLRTFSFYIRKIFWPFPLNFAIIEIDPLYELLAIPLLLGCIYLIWKRRLLGALLLTGLFFIIPSFLIAFYQIAWTPYAERYLYLPCAFILPALLLFSRKQVPQKYTKLGSGLLFILIIGAGSATFVRTITWTNNLSLLADTVQKSPQSPVAQNEYGVALYRAGRLDEAKAAFEKAAKISSIDFNPQHGINHALVLKELGDLWGAKSVFETVLARTKGQSEDARVGLIEVIGKLIKKTSTIDSVSVLQAELLALKIQG